MILKTVFIVLTSFYSLFILVLHLGLRRLKLKSNNNHQPYVSIIVPARNEAEFISDLLHSLLKQSYPSELYEVIVINDNSQDNTPEIVTSFAREHTNVKLLDLNGAVDRCSPKKLAIALGVSRSKGEILLTTDADCIVPERWLEIMVRNFGEDVGAVMSWLQIRQSNRILGKMESLDSFSLVLIGAGAVGLGVPFVANAANFGYRKKVFEEVNGFAGIEQFVSGDDDLFLLKMRQKTRWQVAFAVEKDACVWTKATNNLQQFLSQRIRWASKGTIYPWSLKLLELVFFSYYLLIVLLIPVGFFYPKLLVPVLLSILVKFLLDYSFIHYGGKIVKRQTSLRRFIITEFFHCFYILVAGIGGTFGHFQWKGRVYHHGKVDRN